MTPAWVPITALVVSIVVAVWNIVKAALDLRAAAKRRPHLAVGLVKHAAVGTRLTDRTDEFGDEVWEESPEAIVSFTVTVTNAGVEATSVHDVGLHGPAGHESSARNERANRLKVNGPDLPFRLDGGQQAEWTFSDTATMDAPVGSAFRAWAQEYDPKKKTQKDVLSKFTESR